MQISFKDFRAQVPIPNNCPFCGVSLDKSNAAIDHIVPPRLGGANEIDNLRYLCIQCNARKSDRYDPLFEYCFRLLQDNDDTKKVNERTLDYIMRNLSENDLCILEKRVMEKDNSYKRIMAYATRLNDMMQSDKIKVSNDDMKRTMLKMIESYEGVDIHDEKKVCIGNSTFLVDKDFPLEKYMDFLETYEGKIGETYSVYLDEDGRLVIY